jgi:hypothetical protein
MTLARVRALIVIGVLAAIAVATVIWAISTDAQSSRTGNGCGSPAAKAAIPLAKTVKLRVLNATDQEGLANRIGQDLKKAGFVIVSTGNSTDSVESSAQVKYGPKGLGAASLVRAYVKNAETVQDDKRKDAVVDLTLGDEFAQVGITPADQIKAELDKLAPLQLETDAAC